MMTSAPRIAVLAPSGPPVLTTHRNSPIRIGRAPDNDIVVQDPALSRHHAEIRAQSGGWVVRDCDSRNGTRLDGAPLDAPTALRRGSRITLGSTDLVFEPRPPTTHAETETGSLGDAGVNGGDRVGTARDPAADPGLDGLPPLVGDSQPMQALRRMLGRFARSTATVLVTGETGTGKDVVARWLHALSPRADGPFVVIDCGALPGSLIESELFGTESGVATGVTARPGRIETADGGTLFLDEIGELELTAQTRLLRFLHDRTVERIGARTAKRLDVRIVAATNRRLADLVEDGRFRQDLLMRLDVASLTLPPLRERLDDLPALSRHVLRALGADDVLIEAEALRAFERYSWPGNVRELEHAIERGHLLTQDGIIRTRDLPATVRQASGCDAAVPQRVVEPERLLDSITSTTLSFWDAVREPYLRRELAREQVRDLVALARARGGGTWRGASRLLGVDSEYKRFIDFLRNHRLRPEDDDGPRYPPLPPNRSRRPDGPWELT